MERVRLPFPFFMALLICGAALAQPHLIFDHKIGVDWTPEMNENEWMNFVATWALDEQEMHRLLSLCSSPACRQQVSAWQAAPVRR